MQRTKIEFGDYSWPILTGCAQPHDTCATREKCWARSLHKRFGKQWARLYNPDFSPKFNRQLLNAPLRLKKPARILVSFTGDMFGPGVPLAWQQEVLWAINRGNVYSEIAAQHRYLFLTKSPENLAWHNPWPPNAWVGCSITGAETWERQQEMAQFLQNADARIRWLSYEPMLGKCQLFKALQNIDFLVIGAQTGAGKVKPKLDWVLDIIEAADKAKVKLFLKNNLLGIYPELPHLLFSL